MSPLLPVQEIRLPNRPLISDQEIENIEKMIPRIDLINETPGDLLREIENIQNPGKFSDIQLIEELESFSKTLTYFFF